MHGPSPRKLAFLKTLQEQDSRPEMRHEPHQRRNSWSGFTATQDTLPEKDNLTVFDFRRNSGFQGVSLPLHRRQSNFFRHKSVGHIQIKDRRQLVEKVDSEADRRYDLENRELAFEYDALLKRQDSLKRAYGIEPDGSDSSSKSVDHDEKQICDHNFHEREQIERYIAKNVTAPTEIEMETIESGNKRFTHKLEKATHKKIEKNILPERRNSTQKSDGEIKSNGSYPGEKYYSMGKSRKDFIINHSSEQVSSRLVHSPSNRTSLLTNQKDNRSSRSMQDMDDALDRTRRFGMRADISGINLEDLMEVNHNRWECFSWLIVYPENAFKITWDIFMFILVIYFMVAVPLELGFAGVQDHLNDSNPNLEFFFTLMFSIDIALNFFTAVHAQDSEIIITDHKFIARTYLKTWFFVDLISTLPVANWLSVDGSSSNVGQLNKLPRLLRIFKLLRIFRLAKLLPRIEETIALSPAAMKLWKIVSSLLIFWHWIGCIYFLISDLEDFGYDREYFAREGGNQWVPPPHIWCLEIQAKRCNETYWSYKEKMLTFNQFKGLNECFSTGRCPSTYLSQYMKAFYWAVMATVGIGNDIKPVSVVENLYSVFVILIGVGLVAFIIGNVTSLFNSLQSSDHQRQVKLHKIGKLLAQAGVAMDLKRRIMGYYEYSTSLNNTYSDASNVLEDLHYSLRMDLDIALHEELIQRIPMFKALKETRCLMEILTQLNSRIYTPGEYLSVQGEISNHMFVIVHGLLAVIKSTMQTMEVTMNLKSGQAFGEENLVMKQKQTTSVRARTYSTVLTLSKTDFDEIMQQYPENLATIIRIAGLKHIKGAWSKIQHVIKLVRTIRMFGAEINIVEIIKPPGYKGVKSMSSRMQLRTFNIVNAWRRVKMKITVSNAISTKLLKKKNQ